MKYIDKLKLTRRTNKLSEENATTQVKAIHKFNKSIAKMCNIYKRGHDLSGGVFIEDSVVDIIVKNIIKNKNWKNLKVSRLKQTFQQYFTEAQALRLSRLIVLQLDLEKRRNH